MKKMIIDIDKDTVSIDGRIFKAEAGRWPCDRDTYWYMDSKGNILAGDWIEHDIDHIRLATGNCFSSTESAEQCKISGWWAKRIAQETVDRFIRENGIENGFANDRDNYFPCWDGQRLILTWFYNIVYNSIYSVRKKADAEKINAACEAEIKLLLSVQEG